MNYMNVWKKKMMNSGMNESEARENHTKEMYTQKFKQDPSYKRAILTKLDLTEEDLDIRIVNVDKTVKEKRFYLLPNKVVDIGSYIKVNSKYYLVDEFEDNLISPMCKMKECNQIINISKEIKIPCLVEGESYGVKLDSTSEGSFLLDSNTKVKITMPDNHITREIKLGTRIMLRNHKEGIYELSNLDVYNKNLFVFVCKKDNYRDGDDLENGICFNGDLVEPPIADYTIHGEDSIVINREYTYNITPTEGVVTFELDEYTTTNKIAEIISHTDYTVTIKALIPDEVIALNVLHNGVVSGSKDIVTSRR